jgi:hypothetical protein
MADIRLKVPPISLPLLRRSESLTRLSQLRPILQHHTTLRTPALTLAPPRKTPSRHLTVPSMPSLTPNPHNDQRIINRTRTTLLTALVPTTIHPYTAHMTTMISIRRMRLATLRTGRTRPKCTCSNLYRTGEVDWRMMNSLVRLIILVWAEEAAGHGRDRDCDAGH